jgi:hypothetical protein
MRVADQPDDPEELARVKAFPARMVPAGGARPPGVEE